jgi:hypothetical protein
VGAVAKVRGKVGRPRKTPEGAGTPLPSPDSFVADLPRGGSLIASGLTGFGKTHWLKLGLESSRHLAIIDTMATVDRQRHAQGDFTREGWDGDLYTYAELMESHEPLLATPARLVLDPSTYDPNEAGRRVAVMLELLWSIGDFDVVLEEAGGYSRWAVPLIHRLTSAGAHRGLRVFMLTQSLGRITIDARRNAQRLMLFPQADEQDMTELRRKLGKARDLQLRAIQQFDPPLLWKQGDLAS